MYFSKNNKINITIGILSTFFTCYAFAASSSVDCGPAGENSSALQPAISSLLPGETVTISGICKGNYSIDANNSLGAEVTLDGNGSGVISGIGTTSALTISSTSTVFIKNLTIKQDYDVNAVPISPAGGGINNSGILTLSDSVISNSGAIQGGGIYNSGTLTLDHSTIKDGSSANPNQDENGDFLPSFGGGIYNTGTTTLESSTITNTLAFFGFGGGIYNTGVLQVNRSSIYHCDSAVAIIGIIVGGSGGGINNSSTGTVTLNNSTLFDNFATSGGGIRNNNTTNGSVKINNSTIFRNIYFDPAGGGISTIINPDHAGAVVITNSIVAGNVEFTGSEAALERNILGNYTQAGTNVIDVNPKLDLIADNGGPTLTTKPQADSPAINGIVCDPSVTADQRGAPRPGVSGAGNKANCDIGAYETGDLRIEATPNPLTFNQQVNTSVQNTLNVTNTGNLVATLSGGTLSGVNAGAFVFSNSDNVTKLDIAQAKNVYVTFNPTTMGSFSANLDLSFYFDVNNNSTFDSGEASVVTTVALNGTSTISPAIILADIKNLINSIKSGAAGVIGTGSGKTATNHFNTFINMLTNAGNLVSNNDYLSACKQLYDAAVKSDGSNKKPNPPDFIKDKTNATGGKNTRTVYRTIYNIMVTDLMICPVLPPNLPAL